MARKPRDENTIYKLKERFRTFYKWLNKQETIDNNPIEHMVLGSKKYGELVYISAGERDAIEQV